MKLKFYVCNVCGKIIAIVKDSGVSTICCEKNMNELKPSTTYDNLEKHIPVLKVDGSKVTVTIGSQMNPIATEQYIEWILLQTNHDSTQKWLKLKNEPKADFAIVTGEKVEALYEYGYRLKIN